MCESLSEAVEEKADPQPPRVRWQRAVEGLERVRERLVGGRGVEEGQEKGGRGAR